MRKCLGLLCVSAILASTAAGEADKAPAPETSRAGWGGARDADQAKRQPKPLPGFTPERQAAAIEFVRRHHPELAALLARLKKADVAEYRRAVGSLFRASERLAHFQERDPEKYERELKAWKIKSRIQLLVARIRMAPEDERPRRELKQALLEQFDLRSTQLVEDRKKLLERLKKVEAQIKVMQKDRDAQVERQFDLLLRGKKRPGGKDKSGRGKTRAGSEPGARAPERPTRHGPPRLPCGPPRPSRTHEPSPLTFQVELTLCSWGPGPL